MKDHATLVVGSGMHLIARCPVCGDLKASMLRREEGTPTNRISEFIRQAETNHERVKDNGR